jgi:hypothetical protein
MSNLTIDFFTSKSTEVLFSLRCTEYQVWCQSSKRLSKYWAVDIFLCPVQFVPWPLTFWFQNQKAVTYSLGYKSVPSLMCIQQRIFKILSDKYICTSRLTLDLWSIDFKINRGNWFFRMYQCIKFDNICQAKGSIGIEWSVYSNVQSDPWLLTSK